MDERTIFEQALDHADKVSRDAFLRRACGEDTRLRDRVDLLLAAHGKEFRLLDDQVLPAVETAPVSRRVDFSSQTIGRYKLLQKIGEGGFGVVYMAEQNGPCARKVARSRSSSPGWTRRRCIAHFEAERQALAMMDHPNIARVLDAGVTDDWSAVLRYGTGEGRSDHRLLRRELAVGPRSDSNCS